MSGSSFAAALAGAGERLDEHAVVRPARSAGGQRRYSRRQISRVLRITVLTGDGLTLAAASRILELEDRIRELEAGLEAARAEAGRLRDELAASRARPPAAHR